MREFIEQNIRIPLAEVYPITLDQWEDGFRLDMDAEREIAIWFIIAKNFKQFSESESFNLEQKRECFGIMLRVSRGEINCVLDVVQLKTLTRDQAKRAMDLFVV